MGRDMIPLKDECPVLHLWIQTISNTIATDRPATPIPLDLPPFAISHCRLSHTQITERPITQQPSTNSVGQKLRAPDVHKKLPKLPSRPVLLKKKILKKFAKIFARNV